jgi:hypothetical protein
MFYYWSISHFAMDKWGWKRIRGVATLALARDQGKGVARLRAYK